MLATFADCAESIMRAMHLDASGTTVRALAEMPEQWLYIAAGIGLAFAAVLTAALAVWSRAKIGAALSRARSTPITVSRTLHEPAGRLSRA